MMEALFADDTAVLFCECRGCYQFIFRIFNYGNLKSISIADDNETCFQKLIQNSRYMFLTMKALLGPL